MAKVGKQAGGDRNRTRAGQARRQVDKQTGKADGTGKGSWRQQPSTGKAKQAYYLFGVN